MEALFSKGELFVTYDGKNVMRWFSHGGVSGSDPVGHMSDQNASQWAESLFSKMVERGHDVGHLNFAIEEREEGK